VWCWFRGSRFRVQGPGFRVERFKVQGSEVPFFALRATQGKQGSAQPLATERPVKSKEKLMNIESSEGGL